MFKDKQQAVPKGSAADRQHPDMRVNILFFLTSAIVCVFAVETLARGSISQVSLWIVGSPLPFALNAVLVSCFLTMTVAITGRMIPGIALGSFFIILTATVNALKIHVLHTPLFAWDFLYSGQMLALGEAVFSGKFFSILVISGILVSIVFIYAIRRDRRRFGMGTRFSALVLSLIAAGLFAWDKTGPVNTFNIRNMVWDQNQNYSSNGFFLAFSMNISPAIIRQPSGYNKNLVSRLTEHSEYPDGNDCFEGEPVSLVIFMSESFSDLNGEGIETPDWKIPLENLKKISEAYPVFHLVSPTFAGNTSLVEFEVLTGLSNAFLPAGAIPFDHYLSQKTPSLAWILQERGYRTVAVHPFHDWFWNRNAVYPNLGFSEFISLDSFPENAKKGIYISDEALVDKIIGVIDSSDGPYLIHVVSMQNHGPYFRGRYGSDDIRIENSSLPEWLRMQLGAYLTGLRDADMQLGRLAEYLSRRKEPVLFLFFGDHQPDFSYSLYSSLGLMKEGMEKDLLLSQVPGLIWSNRKELTDLSDIPDRLSPAYLPAILLHQMGIKLPPFLCYLRQGLTHYPVIHRSFLEDSGGNLASLDDRSRDPYLKGLKILNFDILFGSRFSWKPDPAPPNQS